MKAQVVEIQEKGAHLDGEGTIDNNPERLVIRLRGIGCSTEAFIQKLISLDKKSTFCAYKDVKDLICDIGGGMDDLKKAKYLVIEAGEIRVIIHS